MNQTLALFAKQPVAGEVKTRLAAATSPQWAAAVAEAFLLDSLDRFQDFPARRVLVYEPPQARVYFEKAASGRFELVPQSAGDLGERMQALLEEELGVRAEAVVVLGTDSPTLPISIIQQAFAELVRADLVLGPCTDGGYYLLGCARRIPDVFAGIDWGTSRVLEQTIRQVRQQSLTFSLLPPWYDVDTLDDWNGLRGHVAALRCAGLDPQIPRTEALLGSSGSTSVISFPTALA